MKKRNIIVNQIAILTMSIILLSSASVAYAAGASISVNPSSDTHKVGEVFTVDVVIDGKNESFNTAKASVAVSSSLQVESVLLGDCNFSFITTPNLTSLSFVGTILGSSSNRCTVYKLSLKPLSVGSGTITLSNASIKKYGTAAEILEVLQNGTYTIKAASNGTTQIPSNQSPVNAAPRSDPGLVTLAVKVLDRNNNAISGASVLLTPAKTIDISGEGLGKVTPLKVLTDKTGIAYLKNVVPGVNKVIVENKGKRIEEKILNVSGKQPVMTFGVTAEKGQPLWFYIVAAGVLLVAVLIIYLVYFNPARRRLSTVEKEV